MDGTSKYVNLHEGPGPSTLPAGNSVGDVLAWNGVEWAPAAAASPFNVVFTGVNSDRTINSAVLAAHKLVSITAMNTTANPVQLVISTNEDDPRELMNELIEANGLLSLTLNYPFTSAVGMIVSSPDWNSANINLSFHQHKLF